MPRTKNSKHCTLVSLILAASICGAVVFPGSGCFAQGPGMGEDDTILMVTSNADSGEGTLREAITNAEDGDTIVFMLPMGSPTITLESDLPDVNANVTFAGDAVINRNGFGPLQFNASRVNPIPLNVNAGGGASPDILTSSTSTVFGDGTVTGNVEIPGIISPGANANRGTIGTFNVDGELNLTGATYQADIASSSNDLLSSTNTMTLTDAILSPNFVGSDFAVGDTFVLVDSAVPLVGTFSNAGDMFQLQNNPFLEAIENLGLGPNQFGLIIQDNGASFSQVVTGCNQQFGAIVVDGLDGGTPAQQAAYDALREASTDEIQNAVNQVSGSLYPNLLSAEINHIQLNVESVRDRVAILRRTGTQPPVLMPWIRGYGITGDATLDDCETPGFLHRMGGVELGTGLFTESGLSAHVFGHFSGGSVSTSGVSQEADVESYRGGVMAEYIGNHLYVLGAAGAGVQSYDVRRSLSAFQGFGEVTSNFDGSAQYAYFETGTLYIKNQTMVAPYLAMAAAQVDIDAISESGDDYFALTNPGGDASSYRGIMGLAFDQSSQTDHGLITSRVRTGWIHEFGDALQTFTSSVASGDVIVDRGTDTGDDWGFIRAQIDFGVLLGGQMMVAYQGQYNGRSSYNAGLFGLRWTH